jgi:hypothetical protein
LPISAPDAVQPAFRHAKEQLTQPFRFSQWWRLAIVGLLAGEMGSMNGCNFNYPMNTQRPPSQHFLAGGLPGLWAANPALFIGLIAAAALVSIGLVVLFTYISSVMRFILFDSIVSRECHIRQGWSRRQGPGYKLFLWQLLLMAATFAALAIVIGIPALCAWGLGWFADARSHVMGLVLGGIACFLLLVFLFLFVGVVWVMTKDFVVPQMALENISAVEGWRRLWMWLKFDKLGYAGYIGMKIVLAIGAAIATVIVTLIAFVLLLIPIGGVAVGVLFGGKAAGWTWNPYTITLAVIVGCVVLAILIFAAAMISVPVIVFFPAYSIYFFASRYTQLASLLWPEPPPSPAPAPAAPG